MDTKITMQNKDAVARKLAEYANTLPIGGDNDELFNNLHRVSEALERVGEVGSEFRSLADLKTVQVPPMIKDNKVIERNRTYFDLLIEGIRRLGGKTA